MRGRPCRESASYTEYHWIRMEVLPSMTGLWQVSVRTIPAVLCARGVS